MDNKIDNTNRLVGLAYIKVRNAILSSNKQHYDSLKRLVKLYMFSEKSEDKRKEIMSLYYDKLDKVQW